MVGLGDAKLMLMIGGLCGFYALPFVIGMSILAGCLLGLAVMHQSNAQHHGIRAVRFPYGPCLSLGAVTYIVVG